MILELSIRRYYEGRKTLNKSTFTLRRHTNNNNNNNNNSSNNPNNNGHLIKRRYPPQAVLIALLYKITTISKI